MKFNVCAEVLLLYMYGSGGISLDIDKRVAASFPNHHYPGHAAEGEYYSTGYILVREMGGLGRID